jgi:Leucine-rich repeat (LRR) protein
MPGHHDHFGGLRSLLQAPPHEDTWRALCAALDAYPRPELERVAVPYASDIVRRWPARLRPAPPEWIDALVDRQGDVPQLGVVASITMRDRFIADDEVDALADSPFLHELSTLDLGRHRRMPWSHDQLDHDRVRRIGHAASLDNLRALSLAGHHLRPDALEVVLRAPAFSLLRRLDFSFNNLGFLRHRDLRPAHLLPHLRELDLRDVGLTFVGVEALASYGLLQDLTHLDLADNALADEGVARLAARGVLDALTSLNLARCELNAASVTIALEFALALTRLDLSGNALGDAGASLVARSALAPTLVSLELADQGVADPGARELAAAPMPALRELSLARAAPTSVGLRALARAPWLGQLTRLDLSSVPMAEADLAGELLAHLRDHVTRLELPQTGLTDDALAHLAGAPSLTHLDLRGTSLTDACADTLATLPALTHLDLCDTSVTSEAADALREHLGEHVELVYRAPFDYGEYGDYWEEGEYDDYDGYDDET